MKLKVKGILAAGAVALMVACAACEGGNDGQQTQEQKQEQTQALEWAEKFVWPCVTEDRETFQMQDDSYSYWYRYIVRDHQGEQMGKAYYTREQGNPYRFPMCWMR